MAVQNELAYLPATEIAARIARRDVSPVEVVDYFLDRIDRDNHTVNAYVLVLHEDARRLAREAEKAVVSGARLGSLHGIPIAIKDLFDFKAGVPNTFGCKPFKSWTPTVDATYVARLEQAGAIVLGKTNTPEFGHRGITDNYLFGPTSTPFQIGKNAGGSSGGSAEAVAAFEEAGAHVDEVRVGFKRSQEELCDAWTRQSAVRSAQTADGFKQTDGIDLLGSHRDQISPEFAASLELGWSQSALDYRR